jgi:hypothetical protein
MSTYFWFKTSKSSWISSRTQGFIPNLLQMVRCTMATVKTASTLLWAMKSRTKGNGHSIDFTSVAFVEWDLRLALYLNSNVCVGFKLLLLLSIYFEPSIVIILFELRCNWTMCKLYVIMWTVMAEPLRFWPYVEKVWDPSRFRWLPDLYGLKYAIMTVWTVVFVLMLL